MLESHRQVEKWPYLKVKLIRFEGSLNKPSLVSNPMIQIQTEEAVNE